MQSESTDIFKWQLPLRWEIVWFVILFALAVSLRFYHLGADPPQGISFSQDIETDPPQYTMFARNAVLTGDWNPSHDDRYITYEYSLVSALARVVFAVFGVGIYQANLVGVILSLLSILLFYVVVRHSLGSGGALLALFFVGVNYLGIFFGRRPFLETGMNFLFVAGLAAVAYAEDRYASHVAFGCLTAAAIVFGKIIGAAFIGVPIAYYLIRWIYAKESASLRYALAFAGGFALVAGLWFFVIFRPHASSVTGYVGEQALGLYGMPEGLQSPWRFLWKFLVFGEDSEFFDRMPAMSVASLITVVVLAGLLFKRDRGPDDIPCRNPMLFALAAWLVSVYLAQMPWNYQPVRFQTSMIFPLAALTAAAIGALRSLRHPVNLLSRSKIFIVILFFLMLLLAYQVGGVIVAKLGFDFYYQQAIWYVAAIVAAFIVEYVLLARKRREQAVRFPSWARYGGIALILLVCVFYQGKNYLSWAATPLYTTPQASRDLGVILAPGAVISGPFGPALALENDLGSIIHIFGTSRPDSLLFRRFPVTHLIVEKSNEEVARQLYPEIMKKAKLVCHYYVNCRKLSVYRIAYYTGNAQAATYLLSNFERAMRFNDLRRADSARVYLNRFLKLNPDNISGNILAGYFAQQRMQSDSAIAFFSRAVKFSPTDFNLHYLLGQAYIAKADILNSDSLRTVGDTHVDLATKYDLGYHDFGDFLKDFMRKDTNAAAESEP